MNRSIERGREGGREEEKGGICMNVKKEGKKRRRERRTEGRKAR